MINQRGLIIHLCSQHVCPCTHHLSFGNSLFLNRSISCFTKIVNYQVGRIDCLIDVIIKRTDRGIAGIITELIKSTEICMVVNVTTGCKHVVGRVVKTHDICIPDTFSSTDFSDISSIHGCQRGFGIRISLVEVSCTAGCFLFHIKHVFTRSKHHT